MHYLYSRFLKWTGNQNHTTATANTSHLSWCHDPAYKAETDSIRLPAVKHLDQCLEHGKHPNHVSYHCCCSDDYFWIYSYCYKYGHINDSTVQKRILLGDKYLNSTSFGLFSRWAGPQYLSNCSQPRSIFISQHQSLKALKIKSSF